MLKYKTTFTVFASLILIILAAIINAQMDLLKFNPDVVGATGWWKANNWQASWWEKTFLSPFLDGWHFLKFLTFNIYFSILLLWFNLVQYLRIRPFKWYWYLLYIPFNLAHGLGFELSYNLLRR